MVEVEEGVGMGLLLDLQKEINFSPESGARIGCGVCIHLNIL